MSDASAPSGPIVYLHVGRGRTGTTSLQRFLWTNREVLAERGMTYLVDPGAERAHRARGVGNATWIAHALANKEQDALATFGAWLASRPDPSSNVVLSSEFLWGAGKSKLGSLKAQAAAAGLRLVIVGYIREQVSHMISVYCQRIRKGKLDISLPEYMAKNARVLPRLKDPDQASNYWQDLQTYEAVVGAEGLKIGLFERPRLVGGDVRVDFLDKIGVSAEGLDFDAPLGNESGGIVELELLRAMNALSPAIEVDQRQLTQAARAGELAGDRDLQAFLPREVVDQIRAFYAPSNEKVRAHYFPDIEGGLFTEKPSVEVARPTPAIDRDVLRLVVGYFQTGPVSRPPRRPRPDRPRRQPRAQQQIKQDADEV